MKKIEKKYNSLSEIEKELVADARSAHNQKLWPISLRAAIKLYSEENTEINWLDYIWPNR